MKSSSRSLGTVVCIDSLMLSLLLVNVWTQVVPQVRVSVWCSPESVRPTVNATLARDCPSRMRLATSSMSACFRGSILQVLVFLSQSLPKGGLPQLGLPSLALLTLVWMDFFDASAATYSLISVLTP